MIPMHLGPLHPVEFALTLLLAFGPFVVLAAVIVVRRRHDRVDLTEPVDGPGARGDRIS
jgi:hypothetical protein